MLQVSVNDKKTYSVASEDGKWSINGVPADWDAQWQPNSLVSILYNNRSYTALIESVDKKNKEMALRINGRVYQIALKEPIDQLLLSMGLDMKAMQKAEPVKAPMPGLVLKVLVEPGQQIVKGDALLVLEAMKMENILKASHDATVKAVKVSERTAVEKGAILIELE